MSFLKSMQQRYTTKLYNPNKKISSEKIEELKEILRLSPSSINSQPWKFVFVSNPELKKKLGKASPHNDDKVEKCDTLIVFCRVDNTSIFENDIKNRLSEGAQNYYLNSVKTLSEENTKAWFSKQVYLSIGILLSACAQMKIDATPMEGINNEVYDSILCINGYKAEAAVAIGVRDFDDFNQIEKKPKERKPIDEVIVVED